MAEDADMTTPVVSTEATSEVSSEAVGVPEEMPIPAPVEEPPKPTPEDEKPELSEENDAVEDKAKEPERDSLPPAPILTTSGKKRPPYTYDPKKVTLRFLFANRDGLAVTIECKPADTVGEVKGALLSVWPDELPNCSGGDRVRLVCMGKGILMPDTRTLEDCQVPVFKTHPTPINVSVKPENMTGSSEKVSRNTPSNSPGGNGRNDAHGSNTVSQGCACTIL